jgi:saccharopine dehydrogenase (NAD+, L-lysine-forming)
MTSAFDQVRLWMRHEERSTERRAPIVPDDALSLVAKGLEIVVEDSAQRVFPAAEYAAAGCRVVDPGSWVDAPAETYVVGLKELPDTPAALRHRHIFFGHAYKGQAGSRELLDRFVAGGGALLDLEYLVDDAGRRLAAFGYWAGYVGAALAVLHVRSALRTPLQPTDRRTLDAALAPPDPTSDGAAPRAIVIGALGRSGRGACDALTVAGVALTRWDIAETRALDRSALLAHDILVNTVLATGPVPPFLRPSDLDEPARRLRLVCDVSCDVTSDLNVLPIYDEVTSWTAPVRRVRESAPPLDLIAIDNLPSLLPREASIDFSADLARHLAALGGPTAVWGRCLARFEAAAAGLAWGAPSGVSPGARGERAGAGGEHPGRAGGGDRDDADGQQGAEDERCRFAVGEQV